MRHVVVNIACIVRRRETSSLIVQKRTNELSHHQHPLHHSLTHPLFLSPPHQVYTQCVAEDGLYIQADVSLQYVLRSELIIDSLKVYNTAGDLRNMIGAAAKSSVAHACGGTYTCTYTYYTFLPSPLYCHVYSISPLTVAAIAMSDLY